MGSKPVAIGRFETQPEAELAHQRLADAGIPSRVVSTRTTDQGELTGFALLVPVSDASAANDFLLPEQRPSQSVIREGEATLRIAFAFIVLIVGLGFLFNLFRR